MSTLRLFLTSSYAKGLVGQAVFWAIGYFFIQSIRTAAGYEQNPEPAMVFGAILGVLGFLLFAGVFLLGGFVCHAAALVFRNGFSVAFVKLTI